MAPTSAPLLAPHRKPRWTPTDQQKGILETVFAADSFPSFALRKQTFWRVFAGHRSCSRAALSLIKVLSA